MNEITNKRFWAKVNKTPACWLWTASTREKGYGAFTHTRDSGLVQDRAHRYSWEIHNGAIPDGLCVLHNCPTGDNPACVNPAHLFLGTKAENNQDMRDKGRARAGGSKTPVALCKYSRGEDHPNSRLTSETVVAIRADRDAGLSFSKLAAKYGIGVTTAWKITKEITWKRAA